MKKSFLIFIIVCLCTVCFSLTLVSCGLFEDPILDKPTNFAYDTDAKKIIWNAPNEATGYTVTINGESFNTSTASLEYDSKGKDFTFQIFATADGYQNSETVEFSFVFLNDVKNLQFVDGILRWDAVANATSYQIRYRGVEGPIVTGTSWDGAASGEDITVSVKPLGTNTESVAYIGRYSETIGGKFAPSPVVQFNGSSMLAYWDAVEGMAGYRVLLELNGTVVEDVTLGESSTEYVNSFTKAGTYAIKVQSIAPAGGEYSNSKFSSYEVIRLSVPASSSIKTNTNIQGTTSVGFASVAKSKGYRILLNGVEILTVPSNSFNHVFPLTDTERTDVLEIQPLGNDANILDSLETTKVALTKLAVPKQIVFSGETISWNAVSKASGYIVYIDGRPYESTDTEFKFPSVGEGDHVISVMACGNGKDIINSDTSNSTTIKRLASPTITVANSTITWNAIDMAEGYKVFIDKTSFNTDTTSFPLNPDNISSTTTIKVVALGNGKTTLDSNYSKTTTVHRLPAPSGLSTDNNNIMWNRVDGSSYYTLRVNSIEKTIHEGSSCSWSDFTSGAKQIKIMAHGDGSTYFDSAWSEPISVTKLEAPSISISTDGYSWNAVNRATGYEITKDGDTFHQTATTHNPQYTTSGQKTVTVRAMGDGKTTVSSNWASFSHNVTAQNAISGNPAFRITKSETGENKFIISISNPISGATYKYNINGVETISDKTSYEYTLNNTSGTFTVKIAVKGDGIRKVDSVYCGEQSIHILAAPTVYELLYNSDTTQYIRWTEVNNATEYHLTITKTFGSGSPDEVISVKASSKDTSYLCNVEGVSSIKVEIRAVGNGNTVFDSNTTTKILTVITD